MKDVDDVCRHINTLIYRYLVDAAAMRSGDIALRPVAYNFDFAPNVLTLVMFPTMMLSLIPSLSLLFQLLQYFIIIQFGSHLTCIHSSQEHLLPHFRDLQFHQPIKFGYPLISLLILLVLTYFLGLAVTSQILCSKQVFGVFGSKLFLTLVPLFSSLRCHIFNHHLLMLIHCITLNSVLQFFPGYQSCRSVDNCHALTLDPCVSSHSIIVNHYSKPSFGSNHLFLSQHSDHVILSDTVLPSYYASPSDNIKPSDNVLPSNNVPHSDNIKPLDNVLPSDIIKPLDNVLLSDNV